QAGDEAGCDRVAGGEKDDRYGRRRRLGHWRGRGVRGDHAHLSAKEIGGQRRQTLVATLGPAVFDPYITALYIAGFAEALAEGVCELRIFPGRSAVEEPDYRHRRLLRTRRERPRGRRAAECGQQFPPSDGDCHTPLPCEVRNGTIARHQRAVLTARHLARARRAPSRTVNALAVFTRNDGSSPRGLPFVPPLAAFEYGGV